MLSEFEPSWPPSNDPVAALMAVLIPAMALIFYLGYFFFPFLTASFFAIPFCMFWKRPLKIVVLRPFNRGVTTKPLRQFLRRNLARYGHIYTLADADIKIPFIVWIPIFIGQIGFLQFRLRTLREPKAVARLARVLERRFLRNLNWCMIWSRLFPVKTIDALWKECVEVLLRSVDVIVIDISEVREGIIWELDRVRSLGFMDRVFLVCHDKSSADSKKTALSVFETAETVPLVLEYSHNGCVADFEKHWNLRYGRQNE